MAKENQTNSAQPTLRRIITYVLIAVLAPLLFDSVRFLVTDKCSIIDCDPASWNKIKEIAVQNTNSWGGDYKLSYTPIFIHHLDDKGLTKSNLMQKAEIEVNYVYGDTIYRGRDIRFDDNNLWVDSYKPSVLFSSLPSEDVIERFKRVDIGYRDVYDLTWNKADETLEYPINFVAIHLALEDDTQKEFNAESIWFILYVDTERNSVAYWVDAQTGKIVFTRLT